MVNNGLADGEFELNTLRGRTAMKWGFIALGVLAAASLLAQYGGPGEMRSHTAMKHPERQAAALDSLKTFLNLSEAQVRQLEDLSEQSRAAMQPISTKVRSNQLALHQLMSSSAEPDAVKAGQLVIESRNLRSQLQASRQQLAEKAAAVLTPDQQQKLATLPAAVQAQRQASPGLMPESWPMLRAAAQLGLIASPRRGEGPPAAMHFRRGATATPPPAAQD